MTVTDTHTPPPAHRHLTVARCDQLLTIYTPWLHAPSATTRQCAARAVDGLIDERQTAAASEPA